MIKSALNSSVLPVRVLQCWLDVVLVLAFKLVLLQLSTAASSSEHGFHILNLDNGKMALYLGRMWFN